MPFFSLYPFRCDIGVREHPREFHERNHGQPLGVEGIFCVRVKQAHYSHLAVIGGHQQYSSNAPQRRHDQMHTCKSKCLCGGLINRSNSSRKLRRPGRNWGTRISWSRRRRFDNATDTRREAHIGRASSSSRLRAAPDNGRSTTSDMTPVAYSPTKVDRGHRCTGRSWRDFFFGWFRITLCHCCTYSGGDLPETTKPSPAGKRMRGGDSGHCSFDPTLPSNSMNDSAGAQASLQGESPDLSQFVLAWPGALISCHGARMRHP
jgi:hypothetical protein